MAPTFYAWSDLRNGGEVQEVKTPSGVERKIVVNANVIPRGSKVTKKSLDVTDEEWDHLVTTGSIRSYPLPEEANDRVSPTQAILTRLFRGRGEIEPDQMLELALAHPPLAMANPPAEEGKEIEVPQGV